MMDPRPTTRADRQRAGAERRYNTAMRLEACKAAIVADESLLTARLYTMGYPKIVVVKARKELILEGRIEVVPPGPRKVAVDVPEGPEIVEARKAREEELAARRSERRKVTHNAGRASKGRGAPSGSALPPTPRSEAVLARKHAKPRESRGAWLERLETQIAHLAESNACNTQDPPKWRQQPSRYRKARGFERPMPMSGSSRGEVEAKRATYDLGIGERG